MIVSQNSLSFISFLVEAVEVLLTLSFPMAPIGAILSMLLSLELQDL
jgi:hypothetical protein